MISGYGTGRMAKPKYSNRLLSGLCAGALALAVIGCTPRVDTRGNLPDPEVLADIKPGQQSRDEVAEILGSPSTVAAFDEETWYYISKRTETFAFFEPEINDRQVVIVRFDAKGVVSELKYLGLEDGRVVNLVDRETHTAGNEVTFLQQIFGNVGRFNSGGGGN
jgi:outer membrane protein assembly factor BamE (lipoprotein component of BamABCDE complex)